jgi:peroxiredoxin
MTQESTGLHVGDMAPPFALQAADGQDIRLTDVLSSRSAIVVFIRGTW